MHVQHLRTARRLALKLSARVFEVFDMIESAPLTKPEVQALLQKTFRSMEKSAESGFVPTGPRPDLELSEQQEISKERIVALDDQIATPSAPS